jgi:tRNA (guanine-N7-)-methyltransferase
MTGGTKRGVSGDADGDMDGRPEAGSAEGAEAAATRRRDAAAAEGAAGRVRRNFYGRRRGKALRPTQRRHLEELLPRLQIAGVSSDENPERTPIDRDALAHGARAVWLEIGFGGGEHLHALAKAHPEMRLLGCEPFVNGVAMLLGKLAADDPGNVRIHPGDVRDLVEVLPEAILGRVYLLYPDPWLKARHHKRRLAGPGTLAELARAMAPGAELRLATDILDYAEHAVAAAAETGHFQPVVTAPPAWWAPWPEWQSTRYEAKALREGRVPHYLVWRRR